jgi:hypothetical protein
MNRLTACWENLRSPFDRLRVNGGGLGAGNESPFVLSPSKHERRSRSVVLNVWVILLLTAAGCYQRRDPVVQAAQDLRDMAYDFAAQQEAQRQRLNTLRLGMSDGEVLDAAGPPATRESRATGTEETREVWTYRGGLQPLAILTFVNQRLVEIRIE